LLAFLLSYCQGSFLPATAAAPLLFLHVSSSAKGDKNIKKEDFIAT
jgi:hypothetical protein